MSIVTIKPEILVNRLGDKTIIVSLDTDSNPLTINGIAGEIVYHIYKTPNQQIQDILQTFKDKIPAKFHDKLTEDLHKLLTDLSSKNIINIKN